MKKTVDDEVQVETPAGMASYIVIKVRYQLREEVRSKK